jgi:predicted Zn-dependent protease
VTFFKSHRRALTLAAGLVFVNACLRNPVTQKREAKLISEAAEKQIGLETKKQIIDEYGETKDAVLAQYVAAIGKKLAIVSDRPRLAFDFTVLDTDLINAFAAPGGYIFVTRGLLEEVGSEAELAAVLGHEIAHVCAWHSIGMIQKQMGYGTLNTLGAIAAGISLGPEALIMVAQTANLFTELYLSGYSRENELEADHVGLRYTMSAGYDPRAALSFFEKLSALEKQAGADKWKSYFASHPPTRDRIQIASRYIDSSVFYKRKFSDSAGGYPEILERLPRLAPEDRGQFSGSAFSQARYGIRLAIPDGWVWENQKRLAIASFRKDKADAWGSLLRQTVAKNTSARDFAKKVAAERKWKFFSGKDVLYPAGYGFLGQFAGASSLGGIYQMRVLFIVRGDAGYVLICAAPPDEAADYLVPFEQILRTLRIGV